MIWLEAGQSELDTVRKIVPYIAVTDIGSTASLSMREHGEHSSSGQLFHEAGPGGERKKSWADVSRSTMTIRLPQ